MTSDQSRLRLSIDACGNVLDVNAGASKALFGFNPVDLVGQPLCAFINVFEEWKAKFGEDNSLLVLLMQHVQDCSEASWRVGVSSPGGAARVSFL